MFAAAFLGWSDIRARAPWHSIERTEFNLPHARAALGTVTTSTSTTAGQANGSTATTEPPADPTGNLSLLAVASDEHPPEVQEGIFADAILAYLVPDDSGGSVIVSIPRDTMVIDRCTWEESKIDRTLEACNDAISGPEHGALTIEDLIDIRSIALRS